MTEYCNYKLSWFGVQSNDVKFYNNIDGNYEKLKKKPFIEHIQYQYKDKTNKIFNCRSYPERGPIPLYARCVCCKQETDEIVVANHTEECCGPFDNYLLTDSPVIRNTYKLNIETLLEPPETYLTAEILYSNIFPSSNENSHTIKQRTYFYNSLCFKTKSNIIVKHSVNNITFTNVKDCNKDHDDIKKIIKVLKPPKNATIICTLRRGTDKVNLIPDQDIILNTYIGDNIAPGSLYHHIRNEVNERNEYIFKFSMKDDVTVTCTIKLTRTGTYFYYIVDPENKGNFSHIVQSMRNLQYETEPSVIPKPPLPKVNMKNGQQPNACPTTKHPTNKPIIAVRPVPFSYHGETAMRNQAIIQEGKKNKEGLYEPCCKKLTIPSKNINLKFKSSPHTQVYNIRKKFKKEYSVISEDAIDDWLSAMNEKSIAHKMLRRLWYGFPNELFAEDGKDINEIDTNDPKCAIEGETRSHIGLLYLTTTQTANRDIKIFTEDLLEKCILSLYDKINLAQNIYIPFYVEKSNQDLKEIVLKHPIGGGNLHLTYNGQDLDNVVILSNRSNYKKIKDKTIYNFQINYYLEFDKMYIIVRNPFSIIEPIKPIENVDNFEERLNQLQIRNQS